MNPSTDIKFIISSPGFHISDAINIKDELVGSSAAIAGAKPYITGNYICWISDICLPTLSNLRIMAEFIDKQPDPFIAEFRTHPHPLNEIGLYRVCTIAGKQYARWGMMSRKTFESIGFFDPLFSCFYGDVDLSLRCWQAGGQVKTCKVAPIIMQGRKDNITTSNWAKSRESDSAAFIQKWCEQYPMMLTDHDSTWNIDMDLPL